MLNYVKNFGQVTFTESWTSASSGLAGPVTPTERIFEMKERLFERKAPALKFWHDAAGWCPHCMVTRRDIFGIEEFVRPFSS